MKIQSWRDLIVRAAHGDDDTLLEALAHHLVACEAAKRILRSKGYGSIGQPVDLTAAQVPNARNYG